ncbi:MAG: aspartate kinase [Planctomycetes bacterium]|nr:aspartate kinase [Planctomycetota bacterium]
MKFGGSSVSDGRTIRQVAAIVQERAQQRPALVVSAHAGITDALLAMAEKAAAGDADTNAIAARHRDVLAELCLPHDLLDPLLDELADCVRGVQLVGAVNPKVMDHLASYGERLCARTVAAFLSAEGLPANAVDAWDLGLLTDSAFGRARPLPDEGRIGRAIALLAGVPVITGFIAKDREGHVTTLGRNGSDYSAALIGAGVKAAEIQIWKDVDGVRTADPRLVPAALPIREMSFDEASELSAFGSKVLHPATMAPAMSHGIPVRVLNTEEPMARGTLIVAGSVRDGRPVRGIAHRLSLLLCTITAQRIQPQHVFLARLFELLSARGVDVSPIALSPATATIAIDSVLAESLLPELRTLGDVRCERDQALVGVVGEVGAMGGGAAAMVLSTLAESGVPVRCTSQGARGSTLAVVINDTDCRRAVTKLHERFFPTGT